MHTVCSFSTTIKVAAMTIEVLKRAINIDVPRDEILIIFHTANALLREIRSGGIDLTVKQATKYKTQSRILVPVDDTVTDLDQKLEQVSVIQVRNIEQVMQTGVTILLAV